MVKKDMQDTDHPESESYAVSARDVPHIQHLKPVSSIATPTIPSTSDVQNFPGFEKMMEELRHHKKIQELNEKYAVLSNVAKTFLYLAHFFLGLVDSSSARISSTASFRGLVNDLRADAVKVNLLLGCFHRKETVSSLDWKIKEVRVMRCRQNLPKKLKCVDGKSRKTPKRRHVEELVKDLARQHRIYPRDEEILLRTPATITWTPT